MNKLSESNADMSAIIDKYVALAKEVYAPKAYSGNTAAGMQVKFRKFADVYIDPDAERQLRWWDEETLPWSEPSRKAAPAPAQEVWDEEQAMFVTR